MPSMWNFPIHPPRASTFADEVDILYFALVGLTIFFTILVAVMLGTFAFRYRAGSNASRKNPLHTSHVLELSWSIIPLIMALFIFAWGAKLYADAYKIPDNAMNIDVIGKQWMWHLEHSNGIRENNELHIPIGQDIKLTMISQDVMHAFFIPAFRVQKFVNPGQYTSLWFKATRPGKYYIFCNQYCGTQHSLMGGYVYAMEPADFQRWKDQGGYKGGEFDTAVKTQEEQGAELYQSIGCANCHNQNNNRRGPSLYGIYGSKRQLTTGETVIADPGLPARIYRKPEQTHHGGLRADHARLQHAERGTGQSPDRLHEIAGSGPDPAQRDARRDDGRDDADRNRSRNETDHQPGSGYRRTQNHARSHDEPGGISRQKPGQTQFEPRAALRQRSH